MIYIYIYIYIWKKIMEINPTVFKTSLSMPLTESFSKKNSD